MVNFTRSLRRGNAGYRLLDRVSDILPTANIGRFRTNIGMYFDKLADL